MIVFICTGHRSANSQALQNVTRSSHKCNHRESTQCLPAYSTSFYKFVNIWAWSLFFSPLSRLCLCKIICRGYSQKGFGGSGDLHITLLFLQKLVMSFAPLMGWRHLLHRYCTILSADILGDACCVATDMQHRAIPSSKALGRCVSPVLASSETSSGVRVNQGFTVMRKWNALLSATSHMKNGATYCGDLGTWIAPFLKN